MTFPSVRNFLDRLRSQKGEVDAVREQLAAVFTDADRRLSEVLERLSKHDAANPPNPPRVTR